jgi:hypothetical protein
MLMLRGLKLEPALPLRRDPAATPSYEKQSRNSIHLAVRVAILLILMVATTDTYLHSAPTSPQAPTSTPPPSYLKQSGGDQIEWTGWRRTSVIPLRLIEITFHQLPISFHGLIPRCKEMWQEPMHCQWGRRWNSRVV